MRVTGRIGVAAALLMLLTVGAHAAEIPVIEAARSADLDALRALVAEGADVNRPQGDGATALHWAVDRDSAEMVDLLIKAGATVNSVNDLGVTPLWLACLNGNPSIVARLLQAGAKPNMPLLSGETPLMTASRTGSAEVVTRLLAAGADPNAAEHSKQQTALMWAVAQRHPSVVRALIEGGADIHARTDSRPRRVNTETSGFGREILTDIVQGGFSPLLFAGRSGDLESAKLLVEAGADVNETAPEGVSALVVAAQSGHGDVAEFLLAKGADPNAADAGYTALQSAILHGNVSLVQALLAAGADPTTTLKQGTPARRASADYVISGDYVGATPLWLAARFGQPAIMRVLASKKADGKFAMPDGTTVLAAAIQGARRVEPGVVVDEVDREALLLEAAKVAVELGADATAASEDGTTPLHLAAQRKLNSVIELLVAQGADVNATNKKSQTPLAMASRPPDNSTVELLRKLGAREKD